MKINSPAEKFFLNCDIFVRETALGYPVMILALRLGPDLRLIAIRRFVLMRWRMAAREGREERMNLETGFVACPDAEGWRLHV
jgi:hypothetical protein